MRKSLLTVIVMLIVAVLAVAQGTPAPAGGQGQAAPAAGQGQAAPQQKKEIKDPAEYNAYMAAVQATDPNQKAAALEGFLNQYPNSVMKNDALEMLMGAYQQSNNLAKMQQAADRLLQSDPCNLRALALLAYVDRAQAEAGQNAAQNAQLAGQYGTKGSQCLQSATPPEGQSPADFEKFKSQVAPILEGAAGFSALQAKDYPTAAQHLQVAVDAQAKSQPAPQAGDLLRNVYPLAVAYLSQKPANPLGLYYAAEAANLAAGSPAQAQLQKYAQASYIRYHGGDDGFQELLASAKAPVAPPNFQVAPAPTPAEQAAKLLQTKQVKDMSFDEIELILTSGNQQAADQVWSQVKDKPIALEGKLISSSPTQLQIAGTYDDIQANKADITLTMTDAIPAKAMTVLKDGATVQFQGNPTQYTPNPFMVQMDKGAFVQDTAKAIKAAMEPAATRRAPAKKRTPKK